MLVVVMGSEKVGKTCLLWQYTKHEMPQEYIPKLIDDFTTTRLVSDQETIEILLREILINEYNDRIRPLSYVEADVIVLCYAMDSPPSYADITGRWMVDIKKWCPTIPILLVGTKADLRSTPTSMNEVEAKEMKLITQAQGLSLAKEIGAFNYLECSAVNSEGLDEIFNQVISPGLEAMERKRRKSTRCCFLV